LAVLVIIGSILPVTLAYSNDLVTSRTLLTSGTVVSNYLKGFVVTPNTQSWPDQSGHYFGYEDLLQMKNWGATAVRIHAIRGSWIMPQKGNFSLSYFQSKLDRYVQNCTSLGLYCIIELGDWNWASYFGGGSGMPDWFFTGKYPANDSYRAVSAKDFWDLDNGTQAENRQWFIQWWEFIADRYKNNPWVVFSLYNEPLNPGVGAFTDHAEVRRISASYSRFMEQVYDAIRAKGANQTIIVNQPFVWYQSDIVKVNRTIVWDFHLYVDRYSGMDVFTNLFMERYNRCAVDFGQPFIMLEFGIFPAEDYYVLDYQTILRQEITLMKQYGTKGWIWLEYGSLAGEYGNNLTPEQSTNVVNVIMERT
jgi:hypothetical protein